MFAARVIAFHFTQCAGCTCCCEAALGVMPRHLYRTSFIQPGTTTIAAAKTDMAGQPTRIQDQ
jgi:hypothetical protein